MSNEVEVAYGDNVAGTASRLLAAAKELGHDASVVRTTSDNVFLVPEDVADEAGVSFDAADAEDLEVEDFGTPDDANGVEVPAGTLEERVAWVAEGEDESERTKRANAVHTHETETGLEGDELEQLNADLTVAVHGQAPEKESFDASGLKGKSLEKALKDRKLSTDGTADEKRARVAEFENNKE